MCDGMLLACAAVGDGRPIVLMLCFGGFGDVLAAVPAFRAIAAAFRNFRRILATSADHAPLALGAGLADDVLPIRSLRPVPWPLYRPAIAVDLRGRDCESARWLLA